MTGQDQSAILVAEAEVAGLGPAALESLRRRFGVVPVSARMFLPAIDFADDAGFGDDMAVCVADMHVRRQLADASGLHHLFLAFRAEPDAAFGPAIAFAVAQVRPQLRGAHYRLVRHQRGARRAIFDPREVVIADLEL